MPSSTVESAQMDDGRSNAAMRGAGETEPRHIRAFRKDAVHRSLPIPDSFAVDNPHFKNSRAADASVALEHFK
jgi:hypothetical protein